MNRPAESVARDLFPRASLYAGGPAGGSVREPVARWRAFPYSERHLQCVWFDAALRPPELATSRGETVTVEDPGVWNLEAGPDFLGAAVRVGPGRRRLTGDVEIHIHPAGWQRHGHAEDPRYDRVRMHVTYFGPPLPDSAFPPGTVQIGLREPLAARPSFSFETIDVAAYPYAARAPRPPCCAELRGWDRDAKESILRAAGEERLRRKSERFALAIEAQGDDQVLYEEVLTALGYKQNKVPFRALAAALPHDELRDASAGNEDAAFAVLAGVSGLLPSRPPAGADDETRSWFRVTWDAWWRLRERFESRVMSAAQWTTSGIRPANHPLRRMMAAAVLFTGPETLSARWRRISERKPGAALRICEEQLAGLGHAYWDRRCVPGGARTARRSALIGADRAGAIALNVFAPWLAAIGARGPFESGLLDELPAESDNSVIRQTAHNLFGSHHPRVLYRSGVNRQGLIQIFHDYCLNDRSRCASCRFPLLLKSHRELTRMDAKS